LVTKRQLSENFRKRVWDLENKGRSSGDKPVIRTEKNPELSKNTSPVSRKRFGQERKGEGNESNERLDPGRRAYEKLPKTRKITVRNAQLEKERTGRDTSEHSRRVKEGGMLGRGPKESTEEPKEQV